MFCHRYPTGPCVGGNPGVRSVRDNVATAPGAGERTARGARDCQPRDGQALGLRGMANTCEPLPRRRYPKHAQEADRHGPKGTQSGQGGEGSPCADAALPAQRRGLIPAGMVQVRNVVSPTVSIGSVEGGPRGLTGGRGGMGGRRKRRPICNRSDRGSSFALPRKGADFRLVLDHEKGAERLNHRGYFRRCVPSAPLKARWAFGVSSVQPRIVKATRCRAAGCFAVPYQGLSPVRGNSHAGF